jgi:hypothetical protein
LNSIDLKDIQTLFFCKYLSINSLQNTSLKLQNLRYLLQDK